MLVVALTFVVCSAALGFAVRPALAGTWTMWLALGAPYLALSAFAVFRFWRNGTLADRLKPRWGDISIGMVIAVILLLGSWGGRALLTPAGTERQAWLFQIYNQIGRPDVIQRSFALSAAVLLVAASEELIWRGLVLDQLKARVGDRRAWLLTTALYAAAVVPTVFTLADPTAGPNPLLVVAALGCGLFWSFTASILGRLPPVIISHMVFTYFVSVQFHPPGL